MKNTSIWQDYHKPNEINNNNINKKEYSTDILIIGGGITGLTSAYFLKDSKEKIMLIDKAKLASGITNKTTAKITYLQQDIYRKLTNMHGPNIAKKYYNSQKEAISIILDIIKKNNISCDLEKVSSILFTNNENNINKLLKEKEILLSYGEKVKDYQDKYYKNAIIVDNTYTFNPIKYLNELIKIISKKILINENTIAKSIEKHNNHYLVKTNHGIINTKKIIIACHYPFYIIPNFFPLKTYIEREYVCMTKTNNPKRITAINIDKELYSLRYYNDYLIFGSNDHKLTNKIDYAKNVENSITNFEKKFHTKPTYTWINQDIISHDKLPFIGKIKDNLYISTAYNTWGMTGSTIGAKLVTDLILNKQNTYQKLFNPNRINIPLIVNSFIGIFSYLKAYIEGIFHKSNPKYIKIKGITYGVYTDSKGKEHKIKLLCPHMKCPLVFNNYDKTWDCPCHGSRFDLDGNIINTPAIKNLK